MPLGIFFYSLRSGKIDAYFSVNPGAVLRLDAIKMAHIRRLAECQEADTGDGQSGEHQELGTVHRLLLRPLHRGRFANGLRRLQRWFMRSDRRVGSAMLEPVRLA